MTGFGIRCGYCLQQFKSHLRLKYHLANEHKVQNEFSLGITTAEYNKLWKESKLAPFDIARDTTKEKRKYF